MPDETSATQPPLEPDAFSQLPDIDQLREQVITMALCGTPFEVVLRTIHAAQDPRSAAIESDYQQRIFAGRTQLGAFDRSIADADAGISRAKALRARQSDLEQQKKGLEQQIAGLQAEVTRRQREVGRERLKTIIDRAAMRCSTAESRLTEEERARRERQILEVQKRAGEIEERLSILRGDLIEVEQRLAAARARLQPVVEQKVTRTVAGFLLWVGYISFAGIGSAVALLLPEISKDSPLSQIFSSVQLLVRAFPSSWNAIEVFLASTLGVILLIALFGTLVVLNDKLLRSFDHDWKRAARQRRRGTKKDPHEFIVSSTTELRRGHYVQLIASLPYVVVSVATICLLAVTAHATSQQGSGGTAQPQIAASIVTTYLGSILALLITASFVMYIVKLLEPAERERSTWWSGWQFLLIPSVLVAGVLYATHRADGNRSIWGLLVLFMLLSCLATAYGVVYRGLFRDVDYLERERRRCLRSIAEVQAEAHEDEEDDETVRDLRSNVRRRREELEELESFAWDESEPTTQHWYDGLTKLFSRKPEVSVPIALLRVTESEAAPEEYARITHFREEISRCDRELASIGAELRDGDVPVLEQRRADLLARKDAAQAEMDSLEFHKKRALWELRSRFDSQLVDLRATYDLAKFVAPQPA